MNCYMALSLPLIHYTSFGVSVMHINDLVIETNLVIAANACLLDTLMGRRLGSYIMLRAMISFQVEMLCFFEDHFLGVQDTQYITPPVLKSDTAVNDWLSPNS